jgi:hypothetical protein
MAFQVQNIRGIAPMIQQDKQSRNKGRADVPPAALQRLASAR